MQVDPNSIPRMAICLDTETSGLDSKNHHVLEIALRVIDTYTGKELGNAEGIVRLSADQWAGRSLAAIAVNGFTWQKLQEEGEEGQVIAQRILSLFDRLLIDGRNSLFLCQNPSFDRPFFEQLMSFGAGEEPNLPYHWLDLASMNWALSIRGGEINPPLSKDRIAASHGLPPEARSHRAMNGVDHLISIYAEVIGFPGAN